MRVFLTALAIAVALLCSNRVSHAGHPTYRILHAPTGQHGRWVSPGHSQPVSRQSYAWGWFGATRHTNSYYHSGYYGWYRQRTDR